jgi:hypothetical protein
MPNDQTLITTVNIVSVSYSGSTWLNLMLGSTAESFSVGEIKWLLGEGLTACTLHGETCPLWSRFQRHNKGNPLRQLRELSGKRVLVVNNSRKALPIQQESGIQPKFIHMIRDGRAVTASYLRKFPAKSMRQAASWWTSGVRRDLRLIRRQPPENTMRVIYEQLKADPAAHLPKICDFIGMPFDPGMIEFWNAEHHFLGGNRGTILSMVNKQQDKHAELPTVVTKDGTTADISRDLQYYRNVDPSTFRDERWKTELTNGQLRIFGLIAGRLNRRFGYPRSLDRQ